MASAVLTIYRGESRSLSFAAVDGAGAAINLTGKTVEFQVKRADGVGDQPLISKSTGSGITHADQLTAPGTGTVALVPADTDDMPPGSYRYDMWLIDGANRYLLQKPETFKVKDPVNSP